MVKFCTAMLLHDLWCSCAPLYAVICHVTVFEASTDVYTVVLQSLPDSLVSCRHPVAQCCILHADSNVRKEHSAYLICARACTDKWHGRWRAAQDLTKLHVEHSHYTLERLLQYNFIYIISFRNAIVQSLFPLLSKWHLIDEMREIVALSMMTNSVYPRQVCVQRYDSSEFQCDVGSLRLSECAERCT